MKERHTVCGELSELIKYGGQFAQNPYGGRKHGGVVRVNEGLCVWSV